jgi:two-component system LytT family sensor kinase
LLVAYAPVSEMFRMYRSIVLLQVLIPSIQFACYIWLNRAVVKKVYVKKNEDISSIALRYTWAVVQLLLIVYLLGPVTNFISFYFLENFPDKGIINAVNGLLPKHPQPLFNTFGGFSIAFLFTAIYLLYAGIRELAIHYIEREDRRQHFRILISNQLSLLALIYFSGFPLLLIFSGPYALGQSTVVMYFLVIPAIIVLVMVNVYGLFPLRSDPSYPRSKFIVRLLFATALAAVPVIFLQRAEIEGRGLFFFGGWIFQLGIITPVSWAIYRQRKDRILQLRGIETELKRSEADLQFLRAQINPHFLFNTLNTLYGTALEEGSRRTAQGIQMLGDMMRFMLHENHLDTIPLSREISYMENYITLQKLRMQSSPNIRIETAIVAGFDHRIAPMLLIPLVENAFKHGISLVYDSWIKIELEGDDQQIQFTVRNSVHPLREHDTEQTRSGIGLNNVVDRLKLLYPGAYQLSARQQGNEFFASLSLKLQKEPVA